MKTIIAGSRNLYPTHTQIDAAVAASGFTITEEVSGTAPGVDRCGEQWAAAREIPIASFPANWALHGRSAGYKRNAEMAAYAEALIAFWDGKSKGTLHMIDLAKKHGLQVFTVLVSDTVS